MGAYRDGHGRGPAPEANEDGLVSELIRQFADPLAFYRELVQNSIDAGATSIGVTLGWESDPKEGTAADPWGILEVSVRDDGSGMSRDVLENQLTVLFRSGKEGQSDKIGKFGIGFVSVLAVAPELVSVSTSEGEGEQWTLELSRDQSFELFRAEGGSSSGTAVSLAVRARRSELEAYIGGSERALVKWCRHAEIPIRFVATRPDSGALHESRIDRPLGFDALVQVRVEDGGTIVVAGLPHDAEPYLGFFNRGLLLHETSKDVLGSVMVSVQDSRLEHTLSRDNVRRDRHHERAMKVAQRVIDKHLTAHVHTVLGELARRQRTEPAIGALLSAVGHAGLDLGDREQIFPLIETVDGRTTVSIRELRKGEVYVATARTAVTQAVARSGAAILDLSIAQHQAQYLGVLNTLAGRSLPFAVREMTLATSVAATGSDLVLMERIADLLGSLLRRPEGPHLVKLQGARSHEMILVGRSGELPMAVDEEAAKADPFRLLMRPPLLINAGHEAVRMARDAAVAAPGVAAALLVRLILAERGDLEADLDDEWLEEASERLR